MSRTGLYDTEIRFATIGELIDAARDQLAPEVWDFLQSGAGEEQSLRANRRAFERWHFVPRTLTGVEAPSTAATFLGMKLDLPILTAPFGGDRLFHTDGHLATARASARHGVGMIAPEAGSHSFDDVSAAAPGLQRLIQLHPIEPVDRFKRLAEDAVSTGYDGICVTVDCPVAGWREVNMRNRFSPALDVFSGNFSGDGEISVAEMFAHMTSPDRPTWTWEHLGEVCAEVGVTWMAKGILHPDDAVLAIEAGASAILVSNHGGRQLDGALASLDALPGIVEAADGRIQIALDSGIRRGADIVKAIALGADAVVLGRLAAYALAADGQQGLERLYELLSAEIRTIMLLCGCARLDELSDRVVKSSP